MNEFDFSLIEEVEIPVVSPEGEEFTLKRASGRVAKEHRNAVMAATIFGPDGKVTGFRNLASVEPRFVAGCLFDRAGKNPSVSKVEGWPSMVLKKLYEKAKEISDVGEDSPIRKALETALNRDDSPISYETFSDWARDLKGKEYSSLSRLFSLKEESVKNSQESSENGSQ